MHVASRPEHLPRDPRDAPSSELADREHVEAGVQRRLGRHPDPSVLVVRVRVGASDHHREGRERRSVVDPHLQVGRTARVAHQQLTRDRAEGRPVELRLGLGELLLEPSHRRRVDAGPAVHREVPAVRHAERELEGLVVERLRDQDAGRLDRVEWQAERPNQDVRRAAGQHTQGGLGAGERVHGLVDRPVAREHDHQVDALLGRLRRELGGVTPLLGLGHLEPEVRRQGLLDHREHRLGHRPGDGIHHEQEPLEAHGHAVSISGSVASPIAPRHGGQESHLLALGERGRGVGSLPVHHRRSHPGHPGEPSPNRADSASTTSPTVAPSASTWEEPASSRSAANRRTVTRGIGPRLSPAGEPACTLGSP